MCLASTKVCWYHFIQAQNKPCYYKLQQLRVVLFSLPFFLDLFKTYYHDETNVTKLTLITLKSKCYNYIDFIIKIAI